jgi:hypothetical protein
MIPRPAFSLLLPILLLSLGLLAAGCSGSGKTNKEQAFPMAPLAGMPAEIQAAPLSVQQSYQFAVANPETLKQIPCYCGCGAMGHDSNLACYLSGSNANGEVQYDPHALGCSICVDITLDTMRMLNQGQDIPAIKAYVDQNYSRFGPPTP